MENKKSLSISNLRFSYEKNNEILHGISAKFTSGKITALIGANGCGKSTLLNLIAGVKKPDSGAILLNGINLNTLKRPFIAQNIAVVHQSNTAPGDITVEKLVSAGRIPYQKVFSSSGKTDKLAIQKALNDTETVLYANKTISTLSGGQMQRVWLAMALAQDTDILLLDEITTYLDIHYQIEIMHLIKELNRKKNITIIMVLHDINLAFEFCDEVIVMKDGYITANGAIETAINEAVLNDAFNVSSKIFMINEKKHCVFKRKGEIYV